MRNGTDRGLYRIVAPKLWLGVSLFTAIWMHFSTPTLAQETFWSEQIAMAVMDDAPVWESPDTSGTPILALRLGDVMFSLDSVVEVQRLIWKRSHRELMWHRVLLRHGRIGWVTSHDFQLYPIGSTNCATADAADTPVFETERLENVDFHVYDTNRIAIISTRIEPSADTFDVTYEIVLPKWPVSRRAPGFVGWVNASALIVTFELMLTDAARHLAGWSMSSDWDTPDNSESAEALLRRALQEGGPRHYFFSEEYDAHDGGLVHPEVNALQWLARLYADRCDTGKTTQTINDIVTRFPGMHSGIGVADGAALWHLGRFQFEKFGQPYESIRTFLKIVELFPAEELRGFEWNTTLDLDALRWINRIGVKSDLPTDTMLFFFDSAKQVCGYAHACVEASIQTAKLMRLTGRYRDAIAELDQTIQHNPSTSFSAFIYRVHFSVDALDIICQVYYRDLRSPDSARAYCHLISRVHSADTLGLAADFFVSELPDMMNGDRDEVLQSYNDYVDTAPHWGVTPMNRLSSYPVGSKLAKRRIKEIEEFSPTRGSINADSAFLRAFLGDSTNVEKVLPKGMSVTVLYDYPVSRGKWLKVRTESGMIGWLKEGEVSVGEQ